jgi:hypothetical protein
MLSSIASISGNRTGQLCYWKRFPECVCKVPTEHGTARTGYLITLGPIGGNGVLANDEILLRTLAKSGLASLYPDDFEKIMKAAINESRSPGQKRSLLSVGFDMFETLDGKVQARGDQKQLSGTEPPEFGFLMDHKLSASGGVQDISLKDSLKTLILLRLTASY